MSKLLLTALLLLLFSPAHNQNKVVEEISKKIEALSEEGKLSACIPLYEELKEIHKQKESWEDYVTVSCELSYVYWGIGQHLKMGEELTATKVIIIENEIDPISNANANLLSYLGSYYDGIGDLDKSLEVFLATLEIDLQLYEQGAEGFDTSYLALDYNNVGYVYNMKGDYVEARNYFEQAFPYLEKDNIENARFLNNIAFSYKEEGKKKQAKSYFFEALNFLNSIPEQRAKYDQLIAIYNNLATVYGEIKPDSAYYYLDLLYQIIPKGEEVEIDLANYYQIRADIDRFLAKHEEAIENSKEALQIRKKLFGNQYPTVSISHIRLGQNYAALHQYEKALEQYQNALSAVIPSFEPQNSIDNPKLENRTTSRDFFLLALKYKAKSLHAIHQAQAAKSTLQLALQLIDQIRYNYLAEGSKYALLERAMPIYEQAIDLAIEMDELEWAFEVAERSKATLLLESIKNSEAQAFAGISEELLEQEREQKVQIAFYERLLNEAEQEEEREKYQRELFDLRQDYQAFLEDLEQAHPEYYELKYEVEYPSVTDLQSELLDEQTALLEYFTGDSSIYLFVLTKQDLQVQQLEKTADFEKNLNTLRKSLSRISDNGFADFTSSSYFIYSNFLQNVLRKLPARISQLLLVPDGQLSYIPFQSLIQHPVNRINISDPRFDTLSYLVQDYAISYVYSSTLLLKNRSNQKSNDLAFGGFAPIFTGGANIPERSDRKELGELPFSRTELENINTLLHGKNYLQNAASLANFKNQATHFNILHLSTHAAVNDENPSQSRIYFHDDYLTINEIYNLPISADLAVLSACETGVGEYKRGEGMLSLARAFMYAGCPSLVTSLWQVNDEKTADLMLAFYGALLEKQSKNQALQQAQVNYLKTASMEAAHPFYWAAFVQVGDQAAIVENNMNWIWWFVLIGIAILIILIYAKRKSV